MGDCYQSKLCQPHWQQLEFSVLLRDILGMEADWSWYLNWQPLEGMLDIFQYLAADDSLCTLLTSPGGCWLLAVDLCDRCVVLLCAFKKKSKYPGQLPEVVMLLFFHYC